MAEKNTNVQENTADSQNSVSVNAVDTEQNTAQDAEQDAETSQVVEQSTEPVSENVSEELPDEANTGTKVREYEAVALHSGVSRLGRLDQAYPDDEPEREDVQGAPDGPINQLPYFLLGASLERSAGNIQVKEKGVIDGAEGGNTPVAGNDSAIGTVTAIDPEGGPVQYFLRGSGGQTQELELTYGTITLDRLTGEFTYELDNEDADTDSLNQDESVAETVQVYAMDEDGAEGSMPLTITVEGTNDKPTLKVESEKDNPLLVHEDATFGNVVGTLTDSGAAVGADVDSEAVLTYGLLQDKATGATVLSQDGSYGMLTIDPDTGKYVYNLANGTNGVAGPVQSLAEGQEVSESFTVRVKDEHGAWADTSVFVTVTGTNDAPTVDTAETVAVEHALKEAGVKNGGNEAETGDTTANGVVQGMDIDSDNPDGKDLVYTIQDGTTKGGISTLSTAYGKLVLNTGTGAYTYTLADSADPQNIVNKLPQGETILQDFTLIITDAHQASVTHDIQFTIQGTNDKPTLTITPTDELGYEGVKESGVVDKDDEILGYPDQGNSDVDGDMKATGQLKGSDVDANSTFHYAIVDGDNHEIIDGKLIINGHNHVFPHENGDSYTVETWVGAMTLKTDGSYEFVLDDTEYAYLNEGATAYPTFIFAVYDEHGAWTTKELTIDVKGTNDEPVIEAAPDLAVSDTASGFIAKEFAESSDVDIHDVNTHRFSLNTEEDDVAGSDITITSVEGFGTVRINAITGEYEYTLNRSNTYVKALDADSVPLQDSFVVYVKDEHGATASQIVNVTITGAEDAPVFATDSKLEVMVERGVEVVNGRAANGTQKEVEGTQEIVGSSAYGVSGKFTATDADADDNDGLTYSFINTTFDEDATAKTQTITTAYGTLVLSTESGAYVYNFNQNNDAVQKLLPGDSILEKFEVQVKDPSNLTDEASLFVTIQGTNDAPVIDVTNSVANVSTNEDASAPLIGTIEAHDVDHADSELSYSLFQQGSTVGTNRLVQTLQGQYGHIVVNQQTGEYRYFLDSDSEAVQELGVDDKGVAQTLTETFTVRVVDALYAHSDIPLTITINGVDDAPIPVEELATIKEDAGELIYSGVGDPTVTGKMVASDIDKDDTPTFILSNSTGKYGTLSLSDEGLYTYTLTKNGDNDVQKLNVGATLTDTFDVQVLSGGETENTTLTVTIEGTNDVPDLITSGFLAPDLTTSGLLGTVMENDLTNVLKPSTNKNDPSYVIAEDVDKGAVLKQYFMVDFDEDEGIYVAAEEGADGQFAEGTTMLTTMRGEYGMLKINGNGKYTYTVDSHHARFSTLDDGDTVTDEFFLTVMDEHGATDTEKVNIIIKGASDGLPSGAKITAVEAKTVTENDGSAATSSMAEGLITLEEAGGDIASAILYLKTAGGPVSSIVDKYGTLTLFRGADSNAYYRYTLHEGADAVESLYEGQEIDLPPYTVGTKDSKGIESTETFVVTIVGTNDAPKLEPATYEESISETADVRVREGKVKATDVDTGDILAYSFATTTGVVTDGDYATLTTAYGTMKLNTKTGDYTYTLLPQSEDLPEGSTAPHLANLTLGSDVTEHFAIEVTDGHALAVGETPVTANVNVTIKAENAAPKLALTNLEVTEDNATAGGHVEASDTPAVTDPDINGLKYAIADNGASVVQGTYGSLILDKATGDYRYVLDTMSVAVQSLGEGEIKTDTFTYTVMDGYDGEAEADLVVTIHGTNDAPVVTVDKMNLFVKETGTADEVAQSGQVSVVDIDANNAGFVYSLRFMDGGGVEKIITGSSDDATNFVTTVYGTVRLTEGGEYTYTVDSDRETTKALAQGETMVERVTLLVQDDHTNLGDAVEQDIAITLTGTNTAPEFDLSGSDYDIVISDARDADTNSLTTAGLTETDSSYIFTGNISGNVTDVDSDLADLRYSIDNTTLVQELIGEHGILEIDSVSGEYTYTMDKEYVTSLGAGVSTSVSESFTIDVRDEYGAADKQQITMEITGENDVPTVVASLDFSLYEDDTGVYTGDSEVTDPDKDDSHTFGFEYTDAINGTQRFMADGSDVSMTTALGTFTMETDGDYSFIAKNADLQHLASGDRLEETFTILAKDTVGNEAEDTVTVTILGRNDAPVFAADNDIVVQNSTTPTTGTFVATDVDEGDKLTFSLVGDDDDDGVLDLIYSRVAVNSEGDYTYTLHAGASLEDAAKDSFTVQVSDNHGGIDTATIMVDLSSLVDDVNEQQAMIQAGMQAG